MTRPDTNKESQDPQGKDDLDLDLEAVQDLDVDPNVASGVRGGGKGMDDCNDSSADCF